MKNKNKIKFEFIDNTRQDEFNSSCKFERSWFGQNKSGEILSIEDYYYFCRDFASAMGFAESTINEWFGDI